MDQQIRPQKFFRQRKLFTLLPVLAWPFLTLFLWALGLVKSQEAYSAPQSEGFNFNLPEAYLDKEKTPADKLGFYEQADRDSARLQALMRDDPYYSGGAGSGQPADSSRLLGLATRKPGPDQTGLNTSPYSMGVDSQQAKVYEKLDQLTASLNANTELPKPKEQDFTTASPASVALANSPEMQRLEELMRGMDGGSGSEGQGGDPEMKELSGMLERILDIQHPERVQQRLKQTSEQNKGQVFAVSAGQKQTPVTSLDANSANGQAVAIGVQHGFFGLDDALSEAPVQNAIQAVVAETQELVNGSTVKLRLQHDVFINGVLIPKDNFLFGLASLEGERLNVQISSLRYENSLFPVDLSVFDLDGLSGIHIPGAISRDAAKQSGDQAIQSIGLSSFDQSIGAQAASAGIELSRNLLSKKVRLIRVTVKAGYQVLLRDGKQAEGQ